MSEPRNPRTGERPDAKRLQGSAYVDDDGSADAALAAALRGYDAGATSYPEVLGTLADLRGVGVDIVTIGQYLRPTTNHLPVARWVEPADFAAWKAAGEAMGIAHVESGPLTRSSYHARQAADAAEVPVATPAGWSGQN